MIQTNPLRIVSIFIFLLLFGVFLSSKAHATLAFHLDFGQDGLFERTWPLAKGEMTSIDIYVSGVPDPGLRAMGFLITYDASKLQVVPEGTFVDTGWTGKFLDHNVSGKLEMAGFRLGPGLVGSRIKLGTIKLRCLESGVTELSLFDRGNTVDGFVLADEQATVLDNEIAGRVFLATVTSVADLTIAVTDSPDPVAMGDHLVYTLTITNQGPSAAVDVVLKDHLPPPLQNSMYSLNDGHDWIIWPKSLVLSRMDAGVSQQVLLKVYVSPSSPDTLIYFATVEAASTDPEESNNHTGQVTTTVILKKGDINADGRLDLVDVIMTLQLNANISLPVAYSIADANENRKIGIDEAIFLLQRIAGLR